MNCFYVLGNKIVVCRYAVNYIEKQLDLSDGHFFPVSVDSKRLFPEKDEAERFAEDVSGALERLDTSDCEWMDGIVIESKVDPMGKALEIYHMGREAWEAKKAAPSAEDRMAQMEADIAYLAMLTDTDMEV